MRVCVDANIIIYSIEGVPDLRARISEAMQKLGSNTTLVASHLVRLECRVKPLREKNDRLLQQYERALADIQLLAVSPEVIDVATDIRAEYGWKTPDALHLATALTGKCDHFLTADRRLSTFMKIPVLVVETDS